MIHIKIHNKEEVARSEKGSFLIGIANFFGVDIKLKVEKCIANEIASSLKKNGVRATLEIK